jgi:hypothetical protein
MVECPMQMIVSEQASQHSGFREFFGRAGGVGRRAKVICAVEAKYGCKKGMCHGFLIW